MSPQGTKTKHSAYTPSEGTREPSNPKKNFRSTVLFILISATLLSTIFIITGYRPDYYTKNPVNFLAMSPTEFAVTTGLDDTGIPLIKQKYFNTTTPPSVGLYGHHIIRNLSRFAFPFDADNSYFFNYYVPHISLRETSDLLRYQEENSALPKNLAIVYISHPYLGLRNLTEYRWNMPLDFYLNSAFMVDVISPARIRFLWDGYMSRLKFRLDWKHLAYGLFNVVLDGGCKKYGIYDIDQTLPPIGLPAWTEALKRFGMANLVNKFEAVYTRDCGIIAGQRLEGLKQDGSFYSNNSRERLVTRPVPPPISDDVWTSDVANSIVAITNEIQAIGNRNNLDIVFFIPPRIAQYAPGLGHEQMDRAVSLMRENGFSVLDTRQYPMPQRGLTTINNDFDPFRRRFDSLYKSGELQKHYMTDEEHVNDKYFHEIISEISSIGYLPKNK